MSIVPDAGNQNMNFDSTLPLRLGCQFIAMNFQTFDANLQTYFSIFGEIGHSFVLKPCSLRYIPRHVLVDTSQMPRGAGCDITLENGEVVISGGGI